MFTVGGRADFTTSVLRIWRPPSEINPTNNIPIVKTALRKSGIKRDNKQTHTITNKRLIEHTRDAVKYPEMGSPVFTHTVIKIVR